MRIRLPIVLNLNDFPELRKYLPGTSVWHFGYQRGGWIKRIAGPEQSNPWGRLSRLFFSYPLPFDITGKFARTDSESGTRTLKGSFFRLMEKRNIVEEIELPPTEKSDSLIIGGVSYGSFSLFAFVLHDRDGVRDYVDRDHPVILTLNGQNHGELTTNILTKANLPELSASSIVEIRLDALEQEALSNIINNSREAPKRSDFTRELEKRVIELLRNDEALQEIERKRQEEKAKKSNAELNQRINNFLSSILSDATTSPKAEAGGNAPGESGGEEKTRTTRPEVAQADPPVILEFLSKNPMYVPEGSTSYARLKSDARPPKYSFHGDNPRMFARLELTGEVGSRLIIAGKSDINRHGYGGISLSCIADLNNPIKDPTLVGTLIVTLQTTDAGRNLETRLPVGIGPRPEKKERKRERDIRTSITFHAPGGDLQGELAQLISEKEVLEFGTQLQTFKDALSLDRKEDCAYWGEKREENGISTLVIEINVANPALKNLFISCKTTEERVFTKERYCKDIVLDCYQHLFNLEDVPDEVAPVVSEAEEKVRAAEIYLNHDKAIRFAIHERDKKRSG